MLQRSVLLNQTAALENILYDIMSHSGPFLVQTQPSHAPPQKKTLRNSPIQAWQPWHITMILIHFPETSSFQGSREYVWNIAQTYFFPQGVSNNPVNQREWIQNLPCFVETNLNILLTKNLFLLFSDEKSSEAVSYCHIIASSRNSFFYTRKRQCSVLINFISMHCLVLECYYYPHELNAQIAPLPSKWGINKIWLKLQCLIKIIFHITSWNIFSERVV